MTEQIQSFSYDQLNVISTDDECSYGYIQYMNDDDDLITEADEPPDFSFQQSSNKYMVDSQTTEYFLLPPSSAANVPPPVKDITYQNINPAAAIPPTDRDKYKLWREYQREQGELFVQEFEVRCKIPL